MMRGGRRRAADARWRDAGTAAWGVFAALFALSAGELAGWKLEGVATDWLPLMGATLVLAAAGGALAAVGAFALPRWTAMPVAFAAGAFWFAQRTVEQSGLGPRGIAAVGALLALAGGIAIWALARRPRRAALLLAAGLAAAAFAAPRPPPSPAPPPDGARRPDIVLIILDTTRHDHLSPYGYAPATTPGLAALAEEAQVYDDAWAVAPWTPPSHASLLTGLLPGEHGVDGEAWPRFPSDVPTLPEILRDAGYRTGGFPCNPNLAAPGWERGYDAYRTPWYRGRHTLVSLLNRQLAGGRGGWALESGTGRALAMARDWWASQAGAPRFLFVNLIDPHFPYAPRAEHRQRFLPGVSAEAAAAVDQNPVNYQARPGISDDDAAILRGLYDGEIAGMDRELGRFFEWLGARGELDSSLIVITSDHGERLGERGLVGHNFDADPTLLRVPLLIRQPGVLAPGRVTRRVQLDGLPGYLLRLAGVEGPPAMAERALDRQQRDVVVAQHQYPAWLVARLARLHPDHDVDRYRGDLSFASDGRFAYVERLRPDGARVGRLIDLARDPAWTRDVSAERPAVLERLRSAARALPPYGHSEPGQLDPETRERLRALGYVD